MKLSLLILSLLYSTVIEAQTNVTWACKVIRSSDPERDGYGPSKALGGPNLLSNEISYDIWYMGYYKALNDRGVETFYERSEEVSALFEFCRAVVPAQIIVTEPMNSGAVTSVVLYDENNKPSVIYAALPKLINRMHRTWAIPVNGITTPVKRIKIISEPVKVEGWNTISAVGITSSIEPYNPMEFVINPDPFLNFRQPFSPVLDKFKELRSCLITPDGKTLFFTSHMDQKNSDIYVSRFENKEWTDPVSIGKPINNDRWNFTAGISDCGKKLYMVNRYKPDGSFLDGAVSVSYKTREGWSMPENLLFNNWENFHKYESYSVSVDQQYIVGQIAHDFCYGEGDLYVFDRKPDGTYGGPINLGSIVNTAEDECNPFLASDNKTLFFASNGHTGYGNLDIYMTRRLDDSWTNWTEPVNLGPKINTSDAELSFQITADGNFAYGYYSNLQKEKVDIYKIDIAGNAEIRPLPAVFLCGSVKDGKTGKELVARIRIENTENGKTAMELLSNKYNGGFQAILENKTANYILSVELGGYAPLRQAYQVQADTTFKEYSLDLILLPE